VLPNCPCFLSYFCSGFGPHATGMHKPTASTHQAGVGSLVVVITAPCGDQAASISQGIKDVLIQAFVPEAPVEAFHLDHALAVFPSVLPTIDPPFKDERPNTDSARNFFTRAFSVFRAHSFFASDALSRYTSNAIPNGRAAYPMFSAKVLRRNPSLMLFRHPDIRFFCES
jgi:hypothetical protein